jgi:hypothetical protein
MDDFLSIKDTRFNEVDRLLFKGLHSKVNQSGKLSKRVKTIKKYGYDVKFAYHIVRLLNEVEQILTEGDLDLQRNREQLKAIRRGDWSLEEIDEYFQKKELDLEGVYSKCTILPVSRPEEAVKKLLLECIEMHYGNIDKFITQKDKLWVAFQNIRDITDEIFRTQS